MANLKDLTFVLFIGSVSMCISSSSCKVRKYYIAAQDVKWDYADSTINLVNVDQQKYADFYLKQGPDRIGKTYWKATYFQYTDETFTTEIPKPAYLGIMGPTIRAEVGDVIEIVYFNNASGVYSMHPHGVFYLKQNEGALYQDETSGRYKNDELVQPGQTVRLTWNVTDRDAPSQSDPNCLPWSYHSHVNTVKDTSTGLMGAIITCKNGILNDNNERKDVAMDIPILMKIYDENLSWYVAKNINEFCSNVSTCQSLKEEEDEDFFESNYMYSLNGRMFGHLQGLEVCVNQKIAFYVMGMGNEFDVHSLYFPGQNLKYQHTRGDTISVYTASFVSAETTPVSVGKWILTDMVDGMARAGMSAFYNTIECDRNSTSKSDDVKVDRRYFLQASDVEWDYGPGGVDKHHNRSLTDDDSKSSYFFDHKNYTQIGGKYWKAKFFEYSNATFQQRIQRAPENEYMGILGPVIYAEVGETISIDLHNTLHSDISFLPHGVGFDFEDHLGNVYGSNATTMGIVKKGDTHVFTFSVPGNLLDESDDPCHSFIYTSGVSPVRDHQSGLVGPLLICRKGYKGLHKTKPKSFFLLVSMFDENESMYLDTNIFIHTYFRDVRKTNEEFKGSNQIFAINGYAFGTIPGLTMCYGENVTWYVMTIGSNSDVHSLGFDGNTFTTNGKNRNVQKLVSGSTAVLNMVPDNPGSWLIESETGLPLNKGAYGRYEVKDCDKAVVTRSISGRVREYFVAAEEVEWDFAPKEKTLIDGVDLNNDDTEGNIFIKDDKDFIGDIYRKAVFREYTDSSFQNRKVRALPEVHLDILGPVIRAEVNDKIIIHFKNKATRSYSMHPQGLKYSASDSGKTYGNLKADVLPGETKTYFWDVPARSGPGPNDPDCIPWIYYSALDQVKDVLSGLVGPILVCRPGTLNTNGRRNDQEQEFFILMSIFNENDSWYLEDNVESRATNRIGTDYLSDPDFEESNKMHSINGRIFGNNHDLLLEYNQTVHWYFMVMGSELDVHTVHTHGHTFVHRSNDHREDSIAMFPGMAEAVEMKTENPGRWLLHCHVLDHISAGMETTYKVLKPGEKVYQGNPWSPDVIG